MYELLNFSNLVEMLLWRKVQHRTHRCMEDESEFYFGGNPGEKKGQS
jgi:hypothetical protein